MLWRLRGEPDALHGALDVLHVQREVTGVHERTGVIDVALAGDRPPMSFPDVEVEALSGQPDHLTGLEGDRAIAVLADLLVRPPWVATPPGFSGLELVVPRGGAFGSGEHDSTQAALALLHRVWPADNPSFADIGTGSGILALYAARRGCAAIYACDIEEASVVAARELVPTAEVRLGGPEVLPTGCAVVMANMTGAELLGNADRIGRLRTPDGVLLLSGMRVGEVPAVLEQYSMAPFAREHRGEFTAVAARR